MQVKCPACGCTEWRKESVPLSIPILCGPPAECITNVYTCNACQTSGDFTGENDAVINTAIKRSKTEAIHNMLLMLEERGCTPSYLERVLLLHPGSTKQWGEANRDLEYALLRIVTTQPHVLKWVLNSGEKI